MCRRNARSSGQVGRDSVYAQGSRAKHTKSMSVVLCRSGQHCNERSIVIELCNRRSLRKLHTATDGFRAWN
jgi:hypothetical protein